MIIAPIIVINILCAKTKDAKKMQEIFLFSPRTLNESIRHKYTETKLNMKTIMSNSNYRKQPVINQCTVWLVIGGEGAGGGVSVACTLRIQKPPLNLPKVLQSRCF